MIQIYTWISAKGMESCNLNMFSVTAAIGKLYWVIEAGLSLWFGVSKYNINKKHPYFRWHGNKPLFK